MGRKPALQTTNEHCLFVCTLVDGLNGAVVRCSFQEQLFWDQTPLSPCGYFQVKSYL